MENTDIPRERYDKMMSSLQNDIYRMRKMCQNLSAANMRRKDQIKQYNELVKMLLASNRITKEEIREYLIKPNDKKQTIMKGSDGKELMNATQLEELRAKYVKAKLDPDVLKDVSKDQHVFFLYPHKLDMFDIKPEDEK